MTDHDHSPSKNGTTRHYSTYHHWDGPGFLHGSIIKAVAITIETDMDTIAAKYEIDHFRAIEKLFSTTETRSQQSHEFVQFVLNGTIVTVHSDGKLIAEPKNE